MPDKYVTFEQAAEELHLLPENMIQLAREKVIRGVRHEGKAKLTKREYKYLKSIIIPGDPPRFRRNRRRPLAARQKLALTGLALWILAPIVYFAGESKAQEMVDRMRTGGRGLAGFANRAHAMGDVEDLIVGKNIATVSLVAAGLLILTIAWCMRPSK